MTVRILQGDCRDVLRTLPDASIDACVTDPPYDLTSKPGGGPHGKGLDTPYARARAGAVPGGFMGMKWDGTGVAFDHATWREVFRVLKPGAHLVAFGGTRTYHRMVCAIEDAGFEIRDQIGWLYGSGFPKSLDVSKAIDKAARGVPQGGSDPTSRNHGRFKGGRSDDNPSGRGFGAGPGAFMLEAGERHGARRELVAEAQRWQGWGTALKPAWEPIVLARKPLVGTVAANVLEHGTGAINVDACRVDGGARPWRDLRDNGDRLFDGGIRQGSQVAPDTTLGRWPANIVHDGSEEVLQAFPQTESVGHTPGARGRGGLGTSGHSGQTGIAERHHDTGSAARFFASFPQEQQCNQSDVLTAASSSNLRSALVDSVRGAVATWPSLAGVLDESCPAPSTSVTASEFATLRECATATMAHIGGGFSRESQHGKLTQCGSRASVAAMIEPTGITTITASLLRSDGSVANATLRITPSRLDRGDLDSRFSYCAKADRADRNDGLQGMPEKALNWSSGEQSPGTFQSPNTNRRSANHHPTVKPTDLMRWLCRLITPPGGTILDPFMGSGSTLKAAELEGFNAIGIELSADYIDIARRRIAADAPLFAEVA